MAVCLAHRTQREVVSVTRVFEGGGNAGHGERLSFLLDWTGPENAIWESRQLYEEVDQSFLMAASNFGKRFSFTLPSCL